MSKPSSVGVYATDISTGVPGSMTTLVGDTTNLELSLTRSTVALAAPTLSTLNEPVDVLFKNVGGNSIFYAACISQTIIFGIYFNTDIGYLWLNFIGAVNTIILATIFNLTLFRKPINQ